MSRGFLSWSIIPERDPLGEFGKMAALLFDEVILQSPTDGVIASVLDHLVLVGEIDNHVAEQLQAVIVPVQRYKPDYQFVTPSPWQHGRRDLVAATEATLMSFLTAEYPNASRGEILHEAVWWGAGLIDAVSTWLELQNQMTCSMLASRAEHHVIGLVFDAEASLTESHRFAEAIAARMPSLSETPWSRIIELRSGRFASSFREKVSELQRQSRASDPQLASEILEELERHDLRTLAMSVRPSEKTSILKGILSNLPLPIPVNPLSVAGAVADWQAAKERSSEFGWLYFLMELEGS